MYLYKYLFYFVKAWIRIRDPDPHLVFRLDPDPHKTDADPKHWFPRKNIVPSHFVAKGISGKRKGKGKGKKEWVEYLGKRMKIKEKWCVRSTHQRITWKGGDLLFCRLVGFGLGSFRHLYVVNVCGAIYEYLQNF